jgi:preprotein translocase subunit SecA
MTALLQRFRPPEGEPISAKVLNKSIETAQKRVEQRNYSIRKHTLEYDDVMNKQRKEVYAFRNDLLQADSTVQIAEEMLQAAALQTAAPFLMLKQQGKDWSKECSTALMNQFPVQFDEKFFEDNQLTPETIIAAFHVKLAIQKNLVTAFRPDLVEPIRLHGILQEVLRNLMTRRIDHLWQEHLLSIDHLRSDVHMRTVGQKDPLLEFKQESFNLFQAFSEKLKLEITRDLFRFEMVPQPSPGDRLQQVMAKQQKELAALKEINEEV